MMNDLIRNIAIDTFIITTFWKALGDNPYKPFFGMAVSIYIVKKYV